MRTLLLFITLLFSGNLMAQVYAPPIPGTATVTSTLALANDPFRKYFLLQNTGAQSIIVKFGAVQSGTEGIVVVAGGAYEPIMAPTNAVYLRSASSTSTYTIQYGR